MNKPDYFTAGRASDLTDKKDQKLYRALEILPGFLAWLTIILVITLSFIKPTWIALFIITFDVYWLIKTIYLVLHLRAAYRKVRQNMRMNWLDKLSQLPVSDYTLPLLKSWQDLYHLILLPMYKEDLELVSATMESLAKSNYPMNKMIVVLALEQRAGEEFNRDIQKEIAEKYGDSFLRLYFTEHPGNLPGEMAGKGSNIAWAGEWAKTNVIDKMQLPY